MAADFSLAPPPKTVDGLLAVPVDVTSVTATFVFDGATSTATADATMTYTVGPTAGNPFFDLRQTVTDAWLDGAPFPPAQLAHHAFGTGSFTDLRVVESVQAAGSVHTLRLRYALGTPQSQLGGSYLPAVSWSAGPRLTFVFGLSDLNRARYAEAWLPANLLFDQYPTTLDVSIVNTMAAHSVITNAAVTPLGANHWRLDFPARFSALSPMLEIRASDTVELATGTAALPVSGTTVIVEAWKPAGDMTDLAGQIAAIGGFLAENENAYGPYLHDGRFVAFFNGGGGMEYEGGTTTAPFALRHETFHSWFARGIKPASQADGWWDEGFAQFHDEGADDAQPFDFTAPPVLLCSRDPWQRHTAGNAYMDGSRLFRGLASLLGVSTLNALMRELYVAQRGGTPVSTARIEEHLLARGGNPLVVDAFHRFAYGLADPSPAPDLWLRDDVGDPGNDMWAGRFWDSPDLWVRNDDDGGTAHQNPDHGEDNWFHARVRNKAGAGTATHFVVTFHARGYLGTEFVYPADFLPATAATAAFDLAPGATTVVKARWPRALVPSAGTHTCLLASVQSRPDKPVTGRHVAEHNNLAQKNLTVVDVRPDTFAILPLVVSNWWAAHDPSFHLEVLRPNGLEVSLLHPSRDFLGGGEPFRAARPARDADLLDCGGRAPSPRTATAFDGAFELPVGAHGRVPVEIPRGTQTVVWLKVAAPGAKPGTTSTVDLVQRHRRTKRIVGGVAVQVRAADDPGRARRSRR